MTTPRPDSPEVRIHERVLGLCAHVLEPDPKTTARTFRCAKCGLTGFDFHTDHTGRVLCSRYFDDVRADTSVLDHVRALWITQILEEGTSFLDLFLESLLTLWRSRAETFATRHGTYYQEDGFCLFYEIGDYSRAALLVLDRTEPTEAPEASSPAPPHPIL